MTRRFTVRGRDVRDVETGQVALMPDRQTAAAAARLMNAEPACAPDYEWATEHLNGDQNA